MDTDLEQMSREQLIEEVKKLRQGVRQHRDSSGHELCWHHPELWRLLPEKTDRPNDEIAKSEGRGQHREKLVRHFPCCHTCFSRIS
jgi:hypothetical protein